MVGPIISGKTRFLLYGLWKSANSQKMILLFLLLEPLTKSSAFQPLSISINPSSIYRHQRLEVTTLRSAFKPLDSASSSNRSSDRGQEINSSSPCETSSNLCMFASTINPLMPGGSRSACVNVEGECDEEEKAYRETLLRLAQWSLEDYNWRSSIFKSNQADRMVEEILARMQGKQASYVRPMDASEESIGPLGRWERSAVEWLSSVMEEESLRAQAIIDLKGQLVRPIEGSELGPLGRLEKTVVDFLRSIRFSERERIRTKTLRPMDLEESIRGPLGQMEKAVSTFFQEIRESERLRAQQSANRGGAVVRPIDVPGPLGELELWIAKILKAEELRAAELKSISSERGGEGSTKILRPKDAKVKGPLGEVEQRAFDFLDQLSAEERERLRNIQAYLKESRPMENSRGSVLGIVEALAVGIIRAPLLILGVVNRVRELMYSEMLSQRDQKIVRDKQQRSEGDASEQR